jgi:pSer/pThr/pTyr-binding forkhead associated (FHA) protein
MSAPKTNYIFSGSDSQGNPIGLKVLGSDLYKSQSGLLLGRNPNSVQLVVADETVSRVHAKLFIAADKLLIEDYGSTSGTIVDNVRIEPSQNVEIQNGSSVQLGDVVLELRYVEPL